MVHHHEDGTVELMHYEPNARCVGLAGEFNGWAGQRHALQPDGTGWWRLRLALPAGEHRFKYVVDHREWRADFAAFGVEGDGFGGWNGVLYVEPAETETPRRLAA